jgi:hypothetical protein
MNEEKDKRKMIMFFNVFHSPKQRHSTQLVKEEISENYSAKVDR